MRILIALFVVAVICSCTPEERRASLSQNRAVPVRTAQNPDPQDVITNIVVQIAKIEKQELSLVGRGLKPHHHLFFERSSGGYYVAVQGKWYVVVPSKALRPINKEESAALQPRIDQFYKSRDEVKTTGAELITLDPDGARYKELYSQFEKALAEVVKVNQLPKEVVSYMEKKGVSFKQRSASVKQRGGAST